MRNNPFWWPVVLFSLLFVTCQKQPHVDLDNPAGIPARIINAEVRGRVVDENNRPVKDALVKAGNSQKLTDESGSFIISQAQLREDLGYVSVEKNGYFRSGRTFVPDETGSIISLKLIPKKTPAEISAAQGGKVTLLNSNNSSVTFQPNSFSTTDNQPYTGTVKVYTSYLDPEAADFPVFMPGDLIGMDNAGEMKGMRSFGMMAVELEAADGRPLKLAEGKAASLTYGVPPSLSAIAPATIPLWFFDESKGYWVQEGMASKQGNEYSGTVTHFTYWNVDIAYVFTELKAVFKTPAGNAVSNHLVYLYDPLTRQTLSTVTNMNGLMRVYVPLNVAFKLTIFDQCRATLYQMDVPPVQGSKHLGTIVINSNLPSLNITGRVLDCQQKPVPNASVYFIFNNYRYEVASAGADGKYTLQLFGCGQVQDVTVIARNNVTQEESAPAAMTIPANGQFATGDLVACANVRDEFIQIIRGTDTLNYRYPEFKEFKAFFYNNYTFRVYANNSLSIFYEANIDMTSVTDSSASFKEVSTNNADSIASYIPAGPVAPVKFTEFGGVGSMVAGSFEGVLKNATRNGYSFNFKISFRVKRY